MVSWVPRQPQDCSLPQAKSVRLSHLGQQGMAIYTTSQFMVGDDSDFVIFKDYLYAAGKMSSFTHSGPASVSTRLTSVKPSLTKYREISRRDSSHCKKWRNVTWTIKPLYANNVQPFWRRFPKFVIRWPVYPIRIEYVWICRFDAHLLRKGFSWRAAWIHLWFYLLKWTVHQ